MNEGYTISDKFSDMDLTVIHKFIANSYWAKNIPLLTLEKALKNSLCFGVFLNTGEQVGFARMITDKATFAYLADVFILEEYRGKGMSRTLLHAIVDHTDLQGLRRIVLATRDAHGLYEKFGFKALSQPDTFMEIRNPNVYQNKD